MKTILLDKVKIEKPVTVEELRVLTGKTQSEFAKNLSIPYGTYLKKEQGNSRFFKDEITKISRATGIPVNLIIM